MNILRLSIAALLVMGLALPTTAQDASSTPSPAVTKHPMLPMLEAQLKDHQRRLIKSQQSATELSFALNEVVEMQSRALKKQDAIGVSTESFPAIMKSLQLQRIELTIDLAGLKAKQEMLVRAQSEMKSNDSDKVLEQLQKILDVEQQNLQVVKSRVDTASVSKTEYFAAKKQVLAVEVQIAEAKARAAESNYATQISSNLLDTALLHAEKQARLDTTESLLSNLTSSRELVLNANENEEEIARIRRSIDRYNAHGRNLEMKIEATQSEIDNLQ